MQGHSRVGRAGAVISAVKAFGLKQQSVVVQRVVILRTSTFCSVQVGSGLLTHLINQTVRANHIDSREVGNGIVIVELGCVGSHSQGDDGIFHTIQPVALRGLASSIGTCAAQGSIVTIATLDSQHAHLIGTGRTILGIEVLQMTSRMEVPTRIAPRGENIHINRITCIGKVVQRNRVIGDNGAGCFVNLITGKSGSVSPIRQLCERGHH